MQAEREHPASGRNVSALEAAAMIAGERASAFSQKRVHVVGVAGSGARGLVHIPPERGVRASGGEMLARPVLEKFRVRGIASRGGPSSHNVDRETQLVLISAAVAK